MAPLLAEVQLALNERSADRVAQQLKDQMGDAGRGAGKEFGGKFSDSISDGTLTTATDAFARTVAPQFAQHGRTTGTGFIDALKRAIGDGIGNTFSDLTAAMKPVEDALGGIGDQFDALANRGGTSIDDLRGRFGELYGIVENIPGGISVATAAFDGMADIQGVQSVLDSVTSLGDTLADVLPKRAAEGARGINAALATIGVPELVAAEVGKVINDQTQEWLRQNAPGLADANNSNVPSDIAQRAGYNARQWVNEHILGQTPPEPSPLVTQPPSAQQPWQQLLLPGSSALIPGGGGPGASAARRGRTAPPSAPSDPTGTAHPAAALSPALRGATAVIAERDAQARQHLATQEALTKARNDERDAQARLTESTRDATKALGDVGAQLDSDFGASKGLPGLAENLFKFVANLGFAPVLGALRGVQVANGYDQSDLGGGIIGALGATGAFGKQFVKSQDPYSPLSSGASTAAGSLNSLATAANTATGALGGGGSTGGGSWWGGARPASAGGAPSEALVKQIASQFGLQVTSEDRPGDPGYHGKGMALDVSNGTANTPQMLAFAQYMAQNYGSSLKELIYGDPSFSQLIGNGQNVTGTGYYSQGTLGEHNNHVHIAAAWGSGGGASPAMPGGLGGQDAVAANFIAQAQAAGMNREQILSGLAVLSQESNMGANPAAYRAQNQNGTPGIMGPFQQDNSYAKYGNRNDPAVASAGFIDQYLHTGLGLDNPNPWAQALAVQRPAAANAGGYDASTLYAGQRNTAASYYDRLAGGGGAGSGLGPGMGGMPRGLAPGFGIPAAPSILGMDHPGGADPSQSVAGGRAFGQGVPASGGIGIGGGGLLGMLGSAAQSGIGLAASGAAMGMDGGAGGAVASAMAGIGIQEIQRAISAGGQYVGALAGGLLETFSLNDSALADPGKSWLGRIGIAAAGARPALPNSAGEMGGKENKNMAEGGKKPPGPMSPQQAKGGKGGQPGADGANGSNVGKGNGDTFNMSVVNNNNDTRFDPTHNDIQNMMSASQASRQPR